MFAYYALILYKANGVMMKPKRFTCRLLAFVVATAATTAWCAPKPAEWSREPDKVMGIKLGEAIPAGSILECKHLPIGADGPCIYRSRSDYLELQAMPDLGFAYDGLVVFAEGRVLALSLTFKQSRFTDMRTALELRYGPASAEKSYSVTTGAGAVISSRQFLWIGHRISLRLTERVGSIDESSAVFVDNALSATEDATKGSKLAEGAKKF